MKSSFLSEEHNRVKSLLAEITSLESQRTAVGMTNPARPRAMYNVDTFNCDTQHDGKRIIPCEWIFQYATTLESHAAKLRVDMKLHTPLSSVPNSTPPPFGLNEHTGTATLQRLQLQASNMRERLGAKAESAPTLKAPADKPASMSGLEYFGIQMADIETLKTHIAHLGEKINSDGTIDAVASNFELPTVAELAQRCTTLRASLEILDSGCTKSVAVVSAKSGFAYDALRGELQSLVSISNALSANRPTSSPPPAATASTENLWHSLEFCVGLHRVKNGAAVFQKALNKKLVTVAMVNTSAEVARLETMLSTLKPSSKEHGVISTKLQAAKNKFASLPKKITT